MRSLGRRENFAHPRGRRRSEYASIGPLKINKYSINPLCGAETARRSTCKKVGTVFAYL